MECVWNQSQTLSTSFNPAVLPLLSTALTLFFAVLEYTTFIAFLRASGTRDHDNHRSIQLWWHHSYYLSLATILSLEAANLSAGSYAAIQYPGNSRERSISIAGTVISVAHLAFAPRIVPIIEALCLEENAKTKKTEGLLKDWLRIHVWRTMLTDLLGALCFAYLVFG